MRQAFLILPILLVLCLSAGEVCGQDTSLDAATLPGETAFYREHFDRIRYLLYFHAGVRFGPTRLSELAADSAERSAKLIVMDEADRPAAQVAALCRTLAMAARKAGQLGPWTHYAEDLWLDGVLRDFSLATAASAQRQAAWEAKSLSEHDPTGQTLNPFDAMAGDALARAAKLRKFLAAHRREAGPHVLQRAGRLSRYAQASPAVDPAEQFVHHLGVAVGRNLSAYYTLRGATIASRSLLPTVTDTWPPRNSKCVSPRTSITLSLSMPVDIADDAVTMTAARADGEAAPVPLAATFWDAEAKQLIITPGQPLPTGATVTVQLASSKVQTPEARLQLDGNGDGRRSSDDDFVLTFRTRPADTPASPPTFTEPPRAMTTLRARRVMVFYVDAADADGAPLQVTAVDLPAGAQFDPHTRIVRWPTTMQDVGQRRVFFRADNGVEQTTLAVTLSVLPDPTVPYDPPPDKDDNQ